MTSLRELAHDPHFRRGSRDMLDFAPGIAAWGLVTGVAMAKSGLSLPLAVLMSLTVYAGSAQLASLPLLASGAPMWVIWAAALCVNLRFVIFSAQWRPFLGHLPRARRVALGYPLADLNLIAFQRAWPSGRREPGQVRYIVGGAATIWLCWQLPSLLGIFLSEAIPTEWGLGFAGTLAMLGLTFGLMHDRSTWTAAFVAGTAAVAAYALPLKLNIVVAIAAAVAAGLMMEHAERAGRRLRGGA
ncbi:AzlC family ABC transporter permease [Piscinibacter sp.]|uniref:AzlC family ABC transporter permease n=1 Tax=Piscinibacter sp. TaxID=1903157 RepID=UPI0039E46B66